MDIRIGRIRLKRGSLYALAFLIITISWSQVANIYGYTATLECIGYGVLLFMIVIEFITRPKSIRRKHEFSLILLVGFLFIIGILLQNLTLTTRFKLILTMLAFLFSGLMADNSLRTFENIRKASYGVLWGVIISLLLSLINELQVVTSSEGFWGFTFGFTGGIQHKNYFAADMLVVYIGLLLYKKSTNHFMIIDTVVRVLSIIFIIISGSRGACVITAVFLIFINFENIKNIRKEQQILLALTMVVMVAVFTVWFFRNVVMNSATYMYRWRGLFNYINYFTEDVYHLIFGNAEMAYEQEQSYVLSIRSVVGWDGSLEFSWLDILIKNGILGIFGYVLVFARYFKSALKTLDLQMRSFILSVAIAMLASSMVETYIQSIHAVFGIYCYMVLSGLCGMVQRQKNH